jgi:hypothetical protein
MYVGGGTSELRKNLQARGTLSANFDSQFRSNTEHSTFLNQSLLQTLPVTEMSH